MFDRRETARRMDDRTVAQVRKNYWAAKRAQAADSAGLVARMEAAGVYNLPALYALEAQAQG